jgi:hypothetical protein
VKKNGRGEGRREGKFCADDGDEQRKRRRKKKLGMDKFTIR